MLMFGFSKKLTVFQIMKLYGGESGEVVSYFFTYRFILLFVIMGDIPSVLMNIYAPNDESKAVDVFKKIKSIMTAENIDSTAKIIMGGDFNCALNPILDRQIQQKTFG